MGVLAAILMATSLLGALYQFLAAYVLHRFTTGPADIGTMQPPVTILKPVCGVDAELYANLRSFCEQRYPRFQVVFGVRSAGDPAVPVVRRLMADLPQADLELVIDPRVYGSNLKVSNLINMMPRARHDVIVVTDSDMRVRPYYLDAIVAPLLRPGVGLVTCLYVGRPIGGIWAQLGAMWINYTFLPAALVGSLIGTGQGCFGATLALRRETLVKLGGFAALRDQLADDYALGAAIRGLGLRLAQSRYVVDTVVDEPDLTSLFRHELRWGRTIRSIAPVGFAFSAVTYPLVTATLTLLVAGMTGTAALCLAAATASRATLVRMLAARFRIDNPGAPLVPVSDLISFIVVVASFCGRDVEWRGRRFRIAAGGKLIALREPGR